MNGIKKLFLEINMFSFMSVIRGYKVAKIFHGVLSMVNSKFLKQTKYKLVLFVSIISLGFVSPSYSALPLAVDGDELPSLAPMLEDVSSAVVNISTSSTIRVEENPLLKDPFFRRFFEGMPQGPRDRRSQSLGSGVIIDSDEGYIVTNHHVVGKADKITVHLEDGREFEAKVVGSDADTDVAVIQVDADELNALKLGDSDALQVGDFVVAIGNPFGLGHTVTSGIVSALGRSGLNIEEYENFIQTDASINPGNSGGALVNLRGELIGINTAIIGRSGNVGIGFAIPVNMVNGLVTQLVEYGEVKRGQLGVYIQDLTSDLADALDLGDRTGALVTEVIPGTAADAAGLQSGDLITEVNGKKIKGAASLRNTVGLMRVGSKLEINYVREGKEKSLTTKIKSSAVDEVAMAESEPVKDATDKLKGASLRALEDEEGVLVVDVDPDSSAGESGLLPNDIITKVNQKPVKTPDDVMRLAKKDKKRVLLNIRRGQGSMFLVIQ